MHTCYITHFRYITMLCSKSTIKNQITKNLDKSKTTKHKSKMQTHKYKINIKIQIMNQQQKLNIKNRVKGGSSYIRILLYEMQLFAIIGNVNFFYYMECQAAPLLISH